MILSKMPNKRFPVQVYTPYLIDELASVGRGVISSKEDEQTRLLALLSPPSFGQWDDAAVLISGHADAFKLRLGIR